MLTYAFELRLRSKYEAEEDKDRRGLQGSIYYKVYACVRVCASAFVRLCVCVCERERE
jgi:hypothetical protein